MSFFGDIGVATRNGFKSVLAARQRSAKAQVTNYLLSLDDETLENAGFKRSELTRSKSVNPMI